jgi:hypothetical protein
LDFLVTSSVSFFLILRLSLPSVCKKKEERTVTCF